MALRRANSRPKRKNNVPSFVYAEEDTEDVYQKSLIKARAKQIQEYKRRLEEEADSCAKSELGSDEEDVKREESQKRSRKGVRFAEGMVVMPKEVMREEQDSESETERHE